MYNGGRFGYVHARAEKQEVCTLMIVTCVDPPRIKYDFQHHAPKVHSPNALYNLTRLYLVDMVAHFNYICPWDPKSKKSDCVISRRFYRLAFHLCS